MAVCQNLVPLVNMKIAGKWMFIPLKMVLIGIDPYPYIISAGVVHCATSRAIEKLSAHDIAVTKQASGYPSSYSHLLAPCELAMRIHQFVRIHCPIVSWSIPNSCCLNPHLSFC